ncbi:galactose oxidase [Lacibacter luteus]|uniref:Galactose oxidase n=1 Tax=Lacibacter luteus TaxID=2508719 RepID=A0A4V1M712_9BACT|nr:kelch repeat-containing protein [Lacibacter luteus]RXK57749.1 galactose oxidase [Lacibacter luteus]
MIRLYISFLSLLMFFTTAIQAQKKQELKLQWSIAAELPVTTNGQTALGFAGMVAAVHNNKLIIAGGANFPDAMPWNGGKKKYYDDVYVYAKKGSRFVLQQQTKLTEAIAYAASGSTTKGIVVAGGENEHGLSKKVYLLTINNTTVATTSLPDLPFAVTNASLTVVDSKIYLGGGETATETSNQFIVLDLNNIASGWQQLPQLSKPTSHAVLLAINNEIYLAGGRKKNSNGISDLYSSVYTFNTLTNQWTEKAALPYALSAGSGVVYQNKILLFGGDKGATFHRTEELIAAINNSKDENEKQRLTEEKAKLQTNHPGFSKEILAYDIIADSWQMIGNIPYDTPVTTTAVKWNDCFILPSGEIKAGIRSSFILSVKTTTRK